MKRICAAFISMKKICLVKKKAEERKEIVFDLLYCAQCIFEFLSLIFIKVTVKSTKKSHSAYYVAIYLYNHYKIINDPPFDRISIY